MNYYNEFDPFAAAWLKELMADRLIPLGDVDTRDMREVSPDDLDGYTQCHFFAGIGGWSLAMQIAGVSSQTPLWTGSPPCQPFSAAGKQQGKDDERHLWPHFFNLIRACKPELIFGEQVASSVRHGWLDDLQDDLENEGYASGAAVLPACGVGAPHKRDRLFYGACLANTYEQQRDWRRASKKGVGDQFTDSGKQLSAVGDADSDRQQARGQSAKAARHRSAANAADWSDIRYVYCKDEKYRPIPAEPSLFPLADGIPNRVGTLRGAGNAIVPQVAAVFVEEFLSATEVMGAAA